VTEPEREPEAEAGRPNKQGELLGIPYDLRAPTVSRVESRMWNKNEPRMFPPKAFGWGWTMNFYWVVHPVKYFRQDRATPDS
jgi:hypothetical protein